MAAEKHAEEWRDKVMLPEGMLFISVRILDDRLSIYVSSRLHGEARSVNVWEGGVVRPPGKSLDECLEAALYRVARASADGLFEAAWERPPADARPRVVP